MLVKTNDGWVQLQGTNAIKSEDRVTDLKSAEHSIRRDVFIGWTPTPNGKLSAQNAHEFNLRVQEMARDLCTSLGIVTDNRVGIPL